MYKEIVRKVSELTGLPPELVDRTYKAYWLSIRLMIVKLPLKKDLSEELFNAIRTNFNIPSLGKLSCTFDRFLKIKLKFNYIKNLKEKYAKGKED